MAQDVNNGVNVEALLAAREALKDAPAAGEFTWRASCKWLNGTHARSTVQGFHGLGEEQSHKTEFSFETDHPEVFASEDKGATPVELVLVGLASCLTAGVAAVAQNRGIQLRSVEARLEGKMNIDGILGIDERRPQRLRQHQGDVPRRCGCFEEGHRGARGAVAEALGGVRHHHQSDQRDGRGRLADPNRGGPIERFTRSSSARDTPGSR